MTSIKDRFRVRLIYGCLASILLFVIACNNENEENLSKEYLVDFTISSFYTHSTIESVLSSQLEYYPDFASIIEHAEYDVQVYKISYKTHYHDSVIIASGLVCLPAAEKKFPVISFQNGTNTAHDNAPSVNPADASYMMMEFMASNGYIVLMTDYIGFGSSADLLHPYYHRTSTNNAIIDLIHAFNELNQMNQMLAAGNDTIYLMGYSQGGWATMSALDEIQHGDSDIEIAAVSCGAGAYDLMTMSYYVLSRETFPGPLYLPYFIYSQQVYGNITDPLTKFFKEPYAGVIPALFDGSYDNDAVNSQLTTSIPDLITESMLENFASGSEFSNLRDLLSENSVSGWITTAKVNIYHGTSDVNVPPEQSAALYEDFIHAGADPNLVSYFELEGLTHGTGLIPWGILTINWFNALENN
jgi:pimeloyl-ACP methyl ester carboxylesterase